VAGFAWYNEGVPRWIETDTEDVLDMEFFGVVCVYNYVYIGCNMNGKHLSQLEELR
jgi:hypothetical protein